MWDVLRVTCDMGRVTCALPHPLCSERRHLYNVVQKMSGSLRCILRLRHIDSTSPLPSPRRRPVADSRHIIYVPSGDWSKLDAKTIADLTCAGSFNQVVLQPTSMNLPAKKYEFNAVFDAEATHDAVFAQVGACRWGRVVLPSMTMSTMIIAASAINVAIMTASSMPQVMPLILSFMDGYTSLLLAYGELASGQRRRQHRRYATVLWSHTPQAKATRSLAPRAILGSSAAASEKCSGKPRERPPPPR
jgi:hypothetical protein